MYICIYIYIYIYTHMMCIYIYMESLYVLRDIWASELTSRRCCTRENVKTCSGREAQKSPRCIFAFWVVRPPLRVSYLLFPEMCQTAPDTRQEGRPNKHINTNVVIISNTIIVISLSVKQLFCYHYCYYHNMPGRRSEQEGSPLINIVYVYIYIYIYIYICIAYNNSASNNDTKHIHISPAEPQKYNKAC